VREVTGVTEFQRSALAKAAGNKEPHTTDETSFAEDVRHYLQLTPRQLPSQYLYDALGSALFDAICELPWYGITRAENRLLAAHRADIFARLPGLTQIVELGPGDGRKLQTLVAATSHLLTAHLIDVSAGALARAAHTLSDSPNVTVVTHEAPFEQGLKAVSDLQSSVPGSQYSRAGGLTLLAFLGSNIGNFDRRGAATLLTAIREAAGPGDALLIGADLVKPEETLRLAYNDPLGVSAAFNLNVLERINRELRGNFDPRAFRHEAVWNPSESRMEMYLVSTLPQTVRIAAIDLDIHLAAGEAIWTESSYKYTRDALRDQLENAGFETIEQWIDSEAAFALTLATTHDSRSTI
jgi:L-histidine Nalpha-methyltransferase